MKQNKNFTVRYIGTYYYAWHIDCESYRLKGGSMIKIDFPSISYFEIVKAIQQNSYEERMSNSLSFKSFTNFEGFLLQYPWEKYALVNSHDDSIKDALETNSKTLLDNLRKDLQS